MLEHVNRLIKRVLYELSTPGATAATAVPGVLGDIDELSLSDQYTIYIALLSKLKRKESQLVELCQNVHSFDYLKGLLNCKKETAIDRLCTILPLIKPREVDAKNLIMKILPVLFCYSTLYDTEIGKIFKIIKIVQAHPAFVKDQEVFAQWFAIFEKRKLTNKKFCYKDESYVQNLPQLTVANWCPFGRTIGYANIELLRTVYRWLRTMKLHKYLYFFASLTYAEMISIDDTNMEYFTRRAGVFDTITLGARKKILREIEDLRKRPDQLLAIIQSERFQTEDVYDALKIVKNVIRSPLSVNMETYLIGLITLALQEISNALITIGTSEEVTPLYRFTLSILKEAYKYSYFNPYQKELFNELRSELSSKMHAFYRTSNSIPMFTAYYDENDNDSSFYLRGAENVAIQMANFLYRDFI